MVIMLELPGKSRTRLQKLSSLTRPQVQFPDITYLAVYPVVVCPGPPAIQRDVHVAELTLQVLQLLLHSTPGQVQPAGNAAPCPAERAPAQKYRTTVMHSCPGQVLCQILQAMLQLSRKTPPCHTVCTHSSSGHEQAACNAAPHPAWQYPP